MLQNLDYCNPIEIYEAPFELVLHLFYSLINIRILLFVGSYMLYAVPYTIRSHI